MCLYHSEGKRGRKYKWRSGERSHLFHNHAQGQEGEAGSRAAWLGAWALESGGLSLNLGSAASEPCDLAYVTLLLCGSVSPLQNGDLNHKCITGLEVGQLSR